MDDTDTIGLIVVIIAVVALFIASNLQGCGNAGKDNLRRGTNEGAWILDPGERRRGYRMMPQLCAQAQLAGPPKM